MADLSTVRAHECHVCATEPPSYVRATAFGLYDDLRPAIHLMKFEGVPSLAAPLGALLADAMAKQMAGITNTTLVLPVPLFRRKRPFNQSALLARSALQFLKRDRAIPRLELRTDLLRRVRRTESQFRLSAAQRRDNVREAFAASPDVRGCHVLLVDDVYTTGATAVECTRVLLKAGAASVRVATLARAARDYVVPWSTGWTPYEAHAGPEQSSDRSSS